MCLKGDDKSNKRLCVKDMAFVSAQIDLPDNGPQGILGLARGRAGERTFVTMLQEQKVIKDAIVGLNFEDP